MNAKSAESGLAEATPSNRLKMLTIVLLSSIKHLLWIAPPVIKSDRDNVKSIASAVTVTYHQRPLNLLAEDEREPSSHFPTPINLLSSAFS